MGSGPLRNRWQFWGLVFSVFLIVLTPSLAGEADWEIGAINAAVVGILLIVLAGFELVHHRFCTDVGQLVLGLWLTGSPHLLDYGSADNFARGHKAIGTLLVLLALLSLFGDRIHKRFGA
jgi:hypothetical protein